MKYVNRVRSIQCGAMLSTIVCCAVPGANAESKFEPWYEAKGNVPIAPGMPSRSTTYKLDKTGKVPALVVSVRDNDFVNQLSSRQIFLNLGDYKDVTRSVKSDMGSGPDTENERLADNIEFYKGHVIASTRRFRNNIDELPTTPLVAVSFDTGEKTIIGEGLRATTIGDDLFFASYNFTPNTIVTHGEPFIWNGTTSNKLATLVSAPDYPAYQGAAAADNFVQLDDDRIVFTAYQYQLVADDKPDRPQVFVSSGPGRELFIYDGKGNQARLLKDIAPGQYTGQFKHSTDSHYRRSKIHNDFRFLEFRHPKYPAGSNPADLTRVVNDCGARIFFTADDGQHGRELWLTDGSDAGTVMVTDLSSGVRSTEFGQLFDYDGLLLFTIRIGEDHWQLWSSDGSRQGTKLIYDFPYNKNAPELFTLYQSKVLFSASDLAAGSELWISDGTRDGTQRLSDINQGSDNAKITDPIVLNDTIYFTAFDNVRGCQLWQSDGTPTGNFRIEGQPENEFVSDYGQRCPAIAELNGRIYFQPGALNSFGSSIWRYTPTSTANAPQTSHRSQNTTQTCEVDSLPGGKRDVDVVLDKRLACISNRLARREAGRNSRYQLSCVNWAASKVADDGEHAKLLKTWFTNASQANNLSLVQRYTEAQRTVLDQRRSCIANRQARKASGDTRRYPRMCWQWAADRVSGINREDTKRLLKAVKRTHPEML